MEDKNDIINRWATAICDEQGASIDRLSEHPHLGAIVTKPGCWRLHVCIPHVPGDRLKFSSAPHTYEHRPWGSKDIAITSGVHIEPSAVNIAKNLKRLEPFLSEDFAKASQTIQAVNDYTAQRDAVVAELVAKGGKRVDANGEVYVYLGGTQFEVTGSGARLAHCPSMTAKTALRIAGALALGVDS